jgi:hypothetical protein
LVLLSCLVASTAAPAVGSFGHDDLGALKELRELLVPGFGESPEFLVGAGGIGLANPVTGTVVPSFQYSVVPAGASIHGFVVPYGFFMARSGTAPGGSGFRLSNPLSFRRSGTASTPPVRVTWQAGTLFDNVLNGAAGRFVPFRIVSEGPSGKGGAPATAPDLPIAAESAGEVPGLREGGDVFDTALLPPGSETPPEASTDNLPSNLPGDLDDGLGGQGPDPASVPGPLPLAGVAIAWRCSRRLRQRLRQVR